MLTRRSSIVATTCLSALLVSPASSPAAPGKTKIKLKGKGVKLPNATLPLAQDTTVTAQLVNDAGGCWETAFAAPAIRNLASEFRDKTP